MKEIIFILALLCMKAAFPQTPKLQDGIYRVAAVIKQQNVQPNGHQAVVHFNSGFLENAPDSATGLLIDAGNFVPLELEKEPLLMDHADKKKTLQLTFSRVAADQLQRFTERNLMKQASLIVNGEALTAHKIRAVITGGKLEISRCDDNACERMYVYLKEKVKH